MKHFRIIQAIVSKEKDDLIKNKKMLLIMFIFPIMFLAISKMEVTVLTEDASAFILMHIILVPIMTMASIVAEEKEKNTLKMLMLSRVKIWEYFLAISYVLMFFIIMGMLIFEMAGATASSDSISCIILILLCAICSLLVGSIIGNLVDNQVSVAPIAVPTTLTLFFLPVIAMFQTRLNFLSKYLYSGVLFHILQTGKVTIQNIIVVLIYLIILTTIHLVFFNSRRMIQNINK